MRRLSGRRGAAVTAALAIVVSLAACAPSPSFDTAAAIGWAHAQSDHAATSTDTLGSAVVLTGEQATPGETSAGTIAPARRATIIFAAPAKVTKLHVRCYGGQTIRIDASVRRSGESAHAGGTAVCDRADHVIGLEGASHLIAGGVTIRATANVPSAAFVSVEGDAAPADPWQGYFDTTMSDPSESFYSQSAGTFGAAGGVGVIGDTDVNVPAGSHRVWATCAGPVAVTVTVSPVVSTDGQQAAPETGAEVWTDLQCPEATVLEIETTSEGLNVRLDSHGEPGAFLYRIDPGAPPRDAPQ